MQSKLETSVKSITEFNFFFFPIVGKQAGGSAPKFTGKPAIRMLGSGVIFEVRVTGDPAPTATWYKGDTEVKDGGRYKISSQFNGSEYVLILEISSVTVEDGGAYKVTAKNSQGSSNANLNLNLEGKPSVKKNMV